MANQDETAATLRYAEMVSAMRTSPRLRIMRRLLSAHPDGLAVGDVAAELQIASSTLSHYLERLTSEGLAKVRRKRLLAVAYS